MSPSASRVNRTAAPFLFLTLYMTRTHTHKHLYRFTRTGWILSNAPMSGARASVVIRLNPKLSNKEGPFTYVYGVQGLTRNSLNLFSNFTWARGPICLIDPGRRTARSKWAIFGKQNWRCGMNRDIHDKHTYIYVHIYTHRLDLVECRHERREGQGGD